MSAIATEGKETVTMHHYDSVIEVISGNSEEEESVNHDKPWRRG